MKVKDYEELKVWQKGIEIVDKVYLATNNFPSEELYGLSSQIRKASVSIPSNTAEGFLRQHTKEYIQFLYVSLGSCAEVDTQLTIAYRRSYLSKERFQELKEDLNHEKRMLFNLVKNLNSHGPRSTFHDPL